jgi:hypothetical protein
MAPRIEGVRLHFRIQGMWLFFLREAASSNKQLGVTTVGEIRAIGGDVISTPGFGNHVTVTGVTGEAVSPLFRIVPNPNPLVIP